MEMCNLPSVLLLQICRLLTKPQVMSLHTLCSFWNELLKSEKARDWMYFPIVLDIQFSHHIITPTTYDFMDFPEKDTIATTERRRGTEKAVNEWSYWNFEGIFLRKITAQISTCSTDLSQDKDERTMSLFQQDVHPQIINRYLRYYDLNHNIHWILFQSLKTTEKYDFCYFWKKKIILVKTNEISWFDGYTGIREKFWSLVLPPNSLNKIILIRIHDGLLWILYPDILFCYNLDGTLLKTFINREGFIWDCFVLRANFIIFYEQTHSCLMIIDRKNPNKPMLYSDYVSKQFHQLKLWNNLLFMKGDDCKSIIVFKLIKK